MSLHANLFNRRWCIGAKKEYMIVHSASVSEDLAAPRPSVSILIPTKNEAENIDFLLKSVLSVIDKTRLNAEVLIVDGASTDDTVARAHRWIGRAPVRIVESDGRRGLAGDIALGAKSARANVVVVMDADLSHPPEKLPELVAPILAGSHDVVIGSRYIPGGETPGWPRRRRMMSRIAAALSWPITNVRDPMSGFFATQRDLLLAVDRDASGFKIGLEVLARCDSQRVMEVPIRFVDRVAGQSKMNAGQVYSYLRGLFRIMGGSVSHHTAVRFGIVGVIGLAIDLLAFRGLLAFGMELGPAHLTSFVFATLANFVLNARWAFRSPESVVMAVNLATYVRFVAVALMAVFLRGGVLGLVSDKFGWPVSSAILIAIAAAAIVNYLGAAFFVFPPESTSRNPQLRWSVAAIGVVAYMFLLRALYIGQVDLIPEEAYYWNYSQHMDIGYLDHPPMVAWLIGLSDYVFGQCEFSIRFGAMFCWFIAAWFVFRLTRTLYDKASALRAVLLMSVLPCFVLAGFIMTPDAPLVACWAGALYFLARALMQEKAGAWWGLGICIGLGMLSKYTIALLGPATLTFVLLHPPSRRWLFRPEPYAAALLALLIFSPVILWNASNNWASFAFQSSRRLSASPEFSTHELIGSALLLLTPLGLIAVALSLWGQTNSPIAIFDTDRVFERARQKFAKVFTLVPLAVFVFFSLLHEVKFNWTAPLWLAAIPAVAWNMEPSDCLDRLHQNCRRVTLPWTPTIAVMLLIFGVMLHYLTLGIPGIGYGERMPIPIGWREMGDHLTKVDEELERETGHEILLLGLDKYFIASQLAFYDRTDGVEESAGRHLLGRSSLMYRWWFDPTEQAGKAAVLVSFDVEKLSDVEVGQYFDRMNPIKEHVVSRNGRVVGRYFYRIGYGYTPL